MALQQDKGLLGLDLLLDAVPARDQRINGSCVVSGCINLALAVGHPFFFDTVGHPFGCSEVD